jgi:hypothetical protein
VSNIPSPAEVEEILNEAAEAGAKGARQAARELVASALPALNVNDMDFAVFRSGAMYLWMDGVPYVLSDYQRAALARGITREKDMTT